MTTKYTPGPWETKESATHIRVVGANNEVLFHDDKRAPMVKADARLIAAAPDLLDALQVLFDSYKQLADSGDSGFWKLEEQPEGQQALAAIAKATGADHDH